VVVAATLVAGCASSPGPWDPLGPFERSARARLGMEWMKDGIYLKSFSNPWARVTENILYVGETEVRYFEAIGSSGVHIDRPMTCGNLADLARQLKSITDNIGQYSRGELPFEDPEYLDGESYAVLVVAKHASVLIDVDNLNLPIVEMGYKIKNEMRGCK
jgi:hypothetical protein